MLAGPRRACFLLFGICCCAARSPYVSPVDREGEREKVKGRDSEEGEQENKGRRQRDRRVEGECRNDKRQFKREKKAN